MDNKIIGRIGYLNNKDTALRVIQNLRSQVKDHEIRAALVKLGINEAPPVREDLVKEIVEAYNAEGKHAEEYYLENEDNSMAEFARDWGYGEGLTYGEMVERIDEEEVIEVIGELEKVLESHQIMNLVQECCDVERTNEFIQHNEMYGVCIGEVEWQPSDDLEERFLELTDEEQELVQNQAEYYVSTGACGGWLYVSMDYDRWVSVLDTDRFLEVAREKLAA